MSRIAGELQGVSLDRIAHGIDERAKEHTQRQAAAHQELAQKYTPQQIAAMSPIDKLRIGLQHSVPVPSGHYPQPYTPSPDSVGVSDFAAPPRAG